MIFYQLDYVVDEIRKNEPSPEQLFLKKYLGAEFEKKEAVYLWERIVDHKWYVSERLRRDIGFRVAAIDYIENFYEAGSAFNNKNRRAGSLRRALGPLGSGLLRSYFSAKSKILQL
jgi:hypothetical protein